MAAYLCLRLTFFDMKIAGTGSALPQKVVTNQMLSEFLDTSDEWISTRTGVKSRRVISCEKLEDLAVEASLKALNDAGLTSDDLDFIICSNVVNEYITPQLSCIVQGHLGATCPCIDINCACAGFVYALQVAESFYKAGKVENVLVVCAEEPTRMTDWNDRSTCVLFGDGAGAAVLTPGDNIKSIHLHAQSSTDKLWQCRRLQNTPYIEKDEYDTPLHMKGQEVFKFAVKAAENGVRTVLDETGICPEDISYYILHQANIRIINAVRESLGIPEEKFPVNIEDHGNISSSTCPILLDECSRRGLIRRGELIVMSAFGAGLVSGTALFEW